MSCPSVTTILPTECIGNSLNTINTNYQSLKTGVCDNQDQINALRSLLYDLSSNMNNFPLAVPYLEFGDVVAPSAGAQYIPKATITRLNMNTEIADLGNHGSISDNIVTLAAGTYSYRAFSGWDTSGSGGSNGGMLGLYNMTASRYISRTGPDSAFGSGDYGCFHLVGQFTITTTSTFVLYCWSPGGAAVRNTGGDKIKNNTLTGVNDDQRTTLCLYKLK